MEPPMPANFHKKSPDDCDCVLSNARKKISLKKDDCDCVLASGRKQINLKKSDPAPPCEGDAAPVPPTEGDVPPTEGDAAVVPVPEGDAAPVRPALKKHAPE